MMKSLKNLFAAKTPAELENAKARFLGKAGRITELMKSLGALPVEEKKARGAAINLAKQAVEAALTDRRQALKDARYIMNVVRIGGLEAFADDIRIPLKYGVDQCVGDTICAGGIMYGQRNIPVILDFCKDIREVAEPGALFLNYANPMAMNTWAALEYGGVNTVGLCHGVQHGAHQIAEVLGNRCLKKG